MLSFLSKLFISQASPSKHNLCLSLFDSPSHHYGYFASQVELAKPKVELAHDHLSYTWEKTMNVIREKLLVLADSVY